MQSGAAEGAAARILFLYSDTGGGHRAAAQAIDRALRARTDAASIETRHVDAFAACGVFPLREGVASYGSMLKVQPSPYPAIYHLTNGRTRVQVMSEIGMPFIRRKFRGLLGSTRPDIVVSVHPLLNTFARQVIEALRLDARLVTVITDLVTIHHSWTAGAVADEYLVPSPEARALCIERGIPPHHVHDLGLPIRDGFAPHPQGLPAAKSELGLDPSRRVLLAMAGGEGGGRLRKMLDQIGPTLRALDLQLVVIAGRNAALQRRLLETFEDMGARVVGFIDEVADYMRAADVLLTKAGPGTIAEAAACGLPVILCDYISGQEKGNLAYVTSRGFGVVALHAESAIAELERLFGPDPGVLEAMRARALAAARPHAAHAIASFLTAMLERREAATRIAPRARS